MSTYANAIRHYPRFEETAYQAQQVFVTNVPGKARHEYIVVHPVKEFLQVQVHHNGPTIGHIARGGMKRIVIVIAIAIAAGVGQASRAQDAGSSEWVRGTIITLNNPSFRISAGKLLVTIKPDGSLEYGSDYTPDAAAKAFWDAVQDEGRRRCQK